MIDPFDDPVPDGGYRWWYLDGTSDDGRHALTAIVFIGSVFSPWYHSARRLPPASALDHVSVNVALYGPTMRWCMTERDAAAVKADATALSIGESTLAWRGETLSLDVHERCAPWPRALRGSIVVDASPASAGDAFALSDDGLHRWQPIAPQTRIRVAFEDPALSWEGVAYVDTNRGAVPLENSFETWHWSRSHADDGSTRIRYDVQETGGRQSVRTLDVDASGVVREGPHGEAHSLPATRFFGLPRPTRLLAGARIDALQTLENAPFYSRSRFIERVGNEAHSVVHESLDMRRFVNPFVQDLLPFRTPRRHTR